MQSPDQTSEPNPQPQVESTEPALDPKPQEAQNSHSPQADEPILQENPQTQVESTEPSLDPKPQEDQDYELILQQGSQQPDLVNGQQPLPTQADEPPASDPPSEDQHKFDEVSEPNHPEPQVEPMDLNSQESQSSQSQQADEPILQENPQPQIESTESSLDPKPQEDQSSQSHQDYEITPQQGSQQPDLLIGQHPLSTQADQPPAIHPLSQDHHQFDIFIEPNHSHPQSQLQAESMDLKPQEGESFQPQQADEPILQQGSQQSHLQNDQLSLPSQSYQPPADYSPYQQQLDYAAYHQEFQQGQDTALKQFMSEHISKNIKAPGRGFVFLYYLVIIFGGAALAHMFYSQNNYKALLSVFKTLEFRDYEFQDTLNHPGSCQGLLGITLGVPIFLVIFTILNVLDLCTSCFGMTGSMYLQFFTAGIWTALAAYATEQRCPANNTLTTMLGADYVFQNPWIYYMGMNFASLGAGILDYNWNSNKEKAAKDKKDLAHILSAC